MTVQTTERRRQALLWVLGAGIALGPGALRPVRAQLLDPFLSPTIYGGETDPGVTVQSRSRPAYDNGGVRAGSFIIRPQVTQSAGYETNVLGLPKPVGSSLAQTQASVSAFSTWSRNSFGVALGVDNVRYFEQPNQSYTNWNASIGGTVDIGRDLLTLQYQHARLNETNRGLDTPTLNAPVSFDLDTATASYRINLNRLSVTPGLMIQNYVYSGGTTTANAVAASNGTATSFSYSQSYRDRVVVIPSLALAYEFSPRRSAILVVRNGTGSYSNPQAGFGNRDYNNPEILGGVDYDLTGIFRLRLLAGYEERLFVSSAYKTIKAPVIEATAVWTPTGLTTVTGKVYRHIQDTADEATAAFTATEISLAVDHEYLRNILLRGSGGVSIGEYTGGSQNLYTALAGVTYLTNRYARVSATYDLQSRSTSGGLNLNLNGQPIGGGYTDHRFLLQLRLAL